LVVRKHEIAGGLGNYFAALMCMFDFLQRILCPLSAAFSRRLRREFLITNSSLEQILPLRNLQTRYSKTYALILSRLTTVGNIMLVKIKKRKIGKSFE